MRRSVFALLGFLALLLAGSQAVAGHRLVRLPYERESSYSRSDFTFASGPEDMRTTVLGNPFEIVDRAFGEKVIEAMQPSHWGYRAVKPSVTFTPEPGPDSRREYRVVAAFGVPEAVQAEAICAGEDIFTPEQPSERIAIRMVFCREDRVLSSTTSTLKGASSPSDRRFERRIAEMTRGLFRLPPLHGIHVLGAHRRHHLRRHLFGFHPGVALKRLRMHRRMH